MSNIPVIPDIRDNLFMDTPKGESKAQSGKDPVDSFLKGEVKFSRVNKRRFDNQSNSDAVDEENELSENDSILQEKGRSRFEATRKDNERRAKAIRPLIWNG